MPMVEIREMTIYSKRWQDKGTFREGRTIASKLKLLYFSPALVRLLFDFSYRPSPLLIKLDSFLK